MDENEAERGTADLPQKRRAYVAGRRKFTRQFKINAVKMVREEGVPMSQVARTLNVSTSVVGRWMRQFSPADGGSPEQALRVPPRFELDRLREELPRLRATNEMLKELVVYFARVQP